MIGGGVIGLELGQVYSSLGSEVSVVEYLPGLIPGADSDIVKPLQKKLESQFKRRVKVKCFSFLSMGYLHNQR